MTGNNPTDRGKLGTKRHILTDNNGIPLSAFISSASTHDIKAVTEVVDNAVIKRPTPTIHAAKNKAIKQHLCLDKAYNSMMAKQEIISRGYVPHLPYRRKRGEAIKNEPKKLHKKRNPARRWVVERTNSWHNRFRKLYTRYEKKVENYLGLVQFSCSIIIYRKMILG
jgi:transposase